MAERQTAVNEHNHEHEHNHDHDNSGSCAVPSFDVTELRVREDIMAKAKDLANMIYSSEEVQHFRRAEQKINANERIQTLIGAIKKKQKEIVAFESFKNNKMVDKIEGEISTLQDELDGIPIVNEFQQSQTDINYLLQMVVSVIRDTVAKKIDVDHDGSAEDPEECMD
jgi:cell fate (sporulation/competence/biofilm development) regulator YmcA (YheA/YmcA/DUF963 family)